MYLNGGQGVILKMPLEYLNLYQLFVNDIAGGNIYIYLGLAFAMIAFFSAQYRFPNQVTLMMFGLFGLLMAVISQSLLIMVLYIFGGLFVWGLLKVIKDV